MLLTPEEHVLPSTIGELPEQIKFLVFADRKLIAVMTSPAKMAARTKVTMTMATLPVN